MDKDKSVFDARIQYVKPEIINVGAVSVAHGGGITCASYGDEATNLCQLGDFAQGTGCKRGESAGPAPCVEGAGGVY